MTDINKHWKKKRSYPNLPLYEAYDKTGDLKPRTTPITSGDSQQKKQNALKTVTNLTRRGILHADICVTVVAYPVPPCTTEEKKQKGHENAP